MDELVHDFGAGPRAGDPSADRPRPVAGDDVQRWSTTSVDRRREDRLHRLAAALAQALSTADVVTATVAQTNRAFGAAGTVVARRSTDGQALELLGSADMVAAIFDDWRRFSLAAPVPLARVVRTGEPIFLESREDWGREFPFMLRAVAGAGYHASAVVPLPVEGRPGGALGIAFTEPRTFSNEERALALTVGRQCAVALERARLFESERAARARAEALAAQLAEHTRALATAREHAEAARVEAEEANAMKTAFLATMSHELRTPLNAIAGYTELLDMGIHGPVTTAQREALVRIRHSSQHLLGLINDILNFARLETGKVEFEVAPSPLGAAFDFVLGAITPQSAAKGLTLDHLPCEASLRILADQDKVRQILLNLFSNAVKFTERGGRISSWVEVDDRVVRARVRDTGIGISPVHLGRIFDPFVQVNRRHSSPTEGAGLGLAISRDLARGMGGDLTVESVEGRGSTFTLELQRAE